MRLGHTVMGTGPPPSLTAQGTGKPGFLRAVPGRVPRATPSCPGRFPLPKCWLLETQEQGRPLLLGREAGRGVPWGHQTQAARTLQGVITCARNPGSPESHLPRAQRRRLLPSLSSSPLASSCLPISIPPPPSPSPALPACVPLSPPLCPLALPTVLSAPDLALHPGRGSPPFLPGAPS